MNLSVFRNRNTQSSQLGLLKCYTHLFLDFLLESRCCLAVLAVGKERELVVGKPPLESRCCLAVLAVGKERELGNPSLGPSQMPDKRCNKSG